MNEDISVKLWIVKFCLKVVYPKYNHYTFLVFLVIKYRIWYKKTLRGSRGMEKFMVKPVPPYVANLLIKNQVEDNLPVVIDKCIIISNEQYIQLCSENLFYIDNGLLWLAMKLSPENKRKQKHKQNICRKQRNILKYNLNFVTSEIHKKLWSDTSTFGLDYIKIVPVSGSKQVVENVAFSSENEFHNILSSFGLEDDNIDVTFHPLSSIEFAPKIATTAEVSLIVNEFDISSDFAKELLNNYFQLPKLLSKNDVFSIELTPDMTGKYHYKYLDLVQTSGSLHFKCKMLACGEEDSDKNQSEDLIRALFIVKGVTQLSLGENIHMLKPKEEFLRVLEAQANNCSLLDLCPTGLKQKFDVVQEAISLFVTGDMSDLSSSLSSPIIPMLLLTGSLGSGRHLIVKTLAKYNGMNCLQIDCNGLQSSTAKQTESKIDATVQKAKASAPVIVLLDNFEVFAVDPENNEDCRVIEYFMNIITDLYQNYTKYPIIFVAIAERQDLKPNILRLFLDKFHIPKLSSQERYDMLEWFARAMQLNIDGNENIEEYYSKEIDSVCNISKSSKDVLQRVAAKTETFLYGDLDTLLHFAIRESYLKQHNSFKELPPDPDLKLVKEEDFNSALESIRNLQSQHLDAPKIPKVYWEDIGGLDKLKKELLKTIEFPIKYPHLFKNSSLKRSGILMYGPPGCGKTLVAKAVSTELNVSFLSVKGPELLNMYIGQSEENVRKVFESARASSPCIVFLDELDALAPRRGAAGDSGGASDRVVSQLLAELDGVASTEDSQSSSMVFVMGATNRPDLLEQSLLRPGRLDRAVYVGPYCGPNEKTSVLTALCRKLKLRPEVNLAAVSCALPDKCTGADLMSVVSTARAAAVRSVVAKLQAGVIRESELSEDAVILGVSELWQGVESFRPSVSEDELAYYESLRSQM